MDVFLQAIKEWAESNKEILSVILVGSYARGTQINESDVDLCIVTTNKSEMLKTQAFIEQFGKISKTQTEYYGACTSVRVWYKDGKEIEFGIVEPSWIEKPLDEGTRKVLADGYKVIIDKYHIFNGLQDLI